MRQPVQGQCIMGTIVENIFKLHLPTLLFRIKLDNIIVSIRELRNKYIYLMFMYFEDGANERILSLNNIVYTSKQ